MIIQHYKTSHIFINEQKKSLPEPYTKSETKKVQKTLPDSYPITLEKKKLSKKKKIEDSYLTHPITLGKNEL